ncbi:MAG: hypothetical protein K0Q79_3505 [Flavipsychrobacter sp.]|jgi:hypothetical protein|nr:hypothetical protein [Flavipsychrobacter sp.]
MKPFIFIAMLALVAACTKKTTALAPVNYTDELAGKTIRWQGQGYTEFNTGGVSKISEGDIDTTYTLQIIDSVSLLIGPGFHDTLRFSSKDTKTETIIFSAQVRPEEKIASNKAIFKYYYRKNSFTYSFNYHFHPYVTSWIKMEGR